MPEPGSFEAAFASKGFAFDSGLCPWQGSRRFEIGRIAALANPELGAKQICPNCSAKFYDLNRRPAVCPKCSESFDPEEAVRNRRVRSRTATPDYEEPEEKEEAAAKKPAESDDDFEEEADDTPEIDEAAEADPIETDDDDAEVDPAVPPAPAGDLGVDFAEDEDVDSDEDDDAVPFIEEEDDDDFPDDEIDVSPDDDDD